MSEAGRLWVLARPRLMPYVMALPLAGYGWGHWDVAAPLTRPLALLMVCVAWGGLHAGTLWLNAAVDQDEGEVLFGEAVPVPPSATWAGYLALGLSVLLAGLAAPLAGALCAICAVLAVLYSHPATLWKGAPVGGPFVNIVGYGLCSPAVGFVLLGRPASLRTLLVWGLCGLGVFGAYTMAQAFQYEEDASRGYRTLVVTLGARRVIQVARLAFVLCALGVLGLALVGFIPRLCALCVMLLWPLDAHMARWAAMPDGGSEREAAGAVKRLLALVLVGLGLASVQYVADSFAGRPVAGLGTVRGLPPDAGGLGE